MNFNALRFRRSVRSLRIVKREGAGFDDDRVNAGHASALTVMAAPLAWGCETTSAPAKAIRRPSRPKQRDSPRHRAASAEDRRVGRRRGARSMIANHPDAPKAVIRETGSQAQSEPAGISHNNERICDASQSTPARRQFRKPLVHRKRASLKADGGRRRGTNRRAGRVYGRPIPLGVNVPGSGAP